MTPSAIIDWGRRRALAARRAIGVRRAVLVLGFGAIALAGAACSDNGGGPPTAQTSCTPSTGTVTFPAAGSALSNGTTVGSGTTATTMTVASSQCASVVGQPVTYTATLSWPATATTAPTSPPGYISIGTGDGQSETAFPGCDKLAISPASGATSVSVTCTYAFSSVTPQTIVAATYNGDATFAPSGGGFVQQVNQASTSTTLSGSAPNGSVYGQGVTFTAAVAASSPGAGTPTGTVVFSDNGSPITCSGGPRTLAANGEATCTTAVLAVGAHSITANYQGDANFATSIATATPQMVNQDVTTTTVSSSANPSVFGQPASFTATVTADEPGSGTPTGNVQFAVDGTDLGSPVALSAGSATSPSNQALSVGTHSITATYQGDTNFAASTTATGLTQTVNQASTSTTVSASPSPSVFGQSVTFTASVTIDSPGAGTPTGTVSFSDNGNPISCTEGTPTLDNGGAASCTTAALSAGEDQVTAAYHGDTNFAASTSGAVGQQVNKADTATTLSPSPGPTVAGQPVKFTATVSVDAPGAGTPTGTVAFFDNGTALGTSELTNQGSSLQAMLTTSAVQVGSRSITATYQGDDDFAKSTTPSAITQTVNKDATTTALSSSASRSVVGQPVIFTATVGARPPGGGTPTGTVQFAVDGLNSGSPVALSGGRASSPAMSSLVLGTHTITATYRSDANFLGSTGAPLVQSVNQAATSTVLASSANPSPFGRAVTFTASVTVNAPGAGRPTGAVDFTENGRPLGTGAVNQSGTATVTTAALVDGEYTIGATYRGDAHFLPSSKTLRQTVGCAVITGTHDAAITVTQATCLQGAALNGDVTISPGGSLLVDHSQVNGQVVSDRAAAVRICSSTLDGGVSLNRTSGFVLLGDGTDNDDAGVAPCGGDTLWRAVNLASSSGPVELGGDTVIGTVNVSGSTGVPAELEGNQVTGALLCSGNAPAPSDGGQANRAAIRLGQCGLPGF